MIVTDEILSAYVDGELDLRRRRQLEKQMTQDADLAERVAAQRRLRSALASAHAEVLEEPVPERLLSVVAGGGAQVIDLKRVREARMPATVSKWTWPTALAACLVLGLALGWGARQQGSPSLIGGAPGEMVAQGALAVALDQQLASAASPVAPIRIGVTFRSNDQLYCRTFRVNRGDGLAGVACRGRRNWRVRMALAERPAAASGPAYRTAASDTPTALADQVDSMIAGAPLDAAGEAAARAKGWRN